MDPKRHKGGGHWFRHNLICLFANPVNVTIGLPDADSTDSSNSSASLKDDHDARYLRNYVEHTLVIHYPDLFEGKPFTEKKQIYIHKEMSEISPETLILAPLLNSEQHMLVLLNSGGQEAYLIGGYRTCGCGHELQRPCECNRYVCMRLEVKFDPAIEDGTHLIPHQCRRYFRQGEFVYKKTGGLDWDVTVTKSDLTPEWNITREKQPTRMLVAEVEIDSLMCPVLMISLPVDSASRSPSAESSQL